MKKLHELGCPIDDKVAPRYNVGLIVLSSASLIRSPYASSRFFLHLPPSRARAFSKVSRGGTTVARRGSTSRRSTSLVNGVVEPAVKPGEEEEETPMVGR